MPRLKKSMRYSIITLVLLSGCTQVVTAPITISGSVLGVIMHVTAVSVDAVIDSNDEQKKN